jgi:hypothetical protein
MIAWLADRSDCLIRLCHVIHNTRHTKSVSHLGVCNVSVLRVHGNEGTKLLYSIHSYVRILCLLKDCCPDLRKFDFTFVSG